MGEKKRITLGDVETMVLAAKQRSLYELTDAISAKDRVRALQMLDAILSTGEGDEAAIGHLFMLAKTFRQMLVILERNVRDQRMLWAALWQGCLLYTSPRRRRDDRPSGRLRKGLYIVPSLFTAANIAMGYYAILQVTHATVAEPWHFDFAAKAIGFAVLFDGLDGRIARMTHTSSDFGRELDSLADVITFGVAPALLARCV